MDRQRSINRYIRNNTQTLRSRQVPASLDRGQGRQSTAGRPYNYREVIQSSMTRPEQIIETAAARPKRSAHARPLCLAIASFALVSATQVWGPAEALAATFLTATEKQTDDAPPLSNWWLNPFRWQNEAEPSGVPAGEYQRTSQPTVPPKQPSPARTALSGLNPFRWKNETRSDRAAPTASHIPQQMSSVEPPDNVMPAVATDGPVQPGSVLKASATANGEQERKLPIEWPAEDLRADPPVRHNSPGQGVNPFAWSNSAPPANHSFGPTRSPLAEKAADLAAEPMHWSNDPRGKPKPQELMPPVEPTFGDTFDESLRYAQPGGDEDAKVLAKTFPPADATEEELIEWEKENLPWTRPFYWANEDRYEIDFESDAPLVPTTSGDGLPIYARPFIWSNDPQPTMPRQSKPVQQPMIAPDVSRDTRRVAYLQNGEELPEPLPAALQSEPQRAQELPDPNGAGFETEGKGALADAETIGEEPPESNALQFLRADTVLLKPGQFQYDYGFTYTKFDTDFPIFVTDGMGVAVTDAEFRIRQLEVPFEVRYGLARRIQLFLNVPFGWANTELTFPTYEEFENDGGLGDITFGGTFLLREHCQDKPDAILTFAAVAPTGEDPFSPAGLSPSAPSLGNGAWSLASNLLFIQNYDPVVVFYGFGTRQSFLTEINGVNFRPGGEYSYQLGVGFAVNSAVTFSTRFNGAYVTEARLAGERLRGTIQEPMTLTLAMTMAKEKKLVEPFVDFGLTDDAVDARIGVTWTR